MLGREKENLDFRRFPGILGVVGVPQTFQSHFLDPWGINRIIQKPQPLTKKGTNAMGNSLALNIRLDAEETKLVNSGRVSVINILGGDQVVGSVILGRPTTTTADPKAVKKRGTNSAQSKRMKAYWKKKRAEQAAAAKSFTK